MNCFLVAGYGSIGRRHISNIREMYPSAKIVVLRHSRNGKREQGKSVTEVDRFVYSMDEALGELPQAAIIAGPAPFHLNMAMRLARKGIHLLIEKPLSDSTTEVDTLLNVCNGSDVCLMVGYNLRFLDSLRRLKTMIDDNSIGRILSVRCEVGQYLPSWRPQQDYRVSVTAQRRLGGGVLLELSHEIDYLLWLFGKSIEVTAWSGKQSGLELDVEDTAHLNLRFAGKSDSAVVPVSLNMDAVRHDASRTCVVIGEEGTLRWDGIMGRLEIFRPLDSLWCVESVDNEDNNLSYKRELEHFVDCARRNVPLVYGATGEDGKKVLQVIEAARSSISLKRTEFVSQ